MALTAVSGSRWGRVAWFALPACVLALAVGSAHRLADTGRAQKPTNERSVSDARPADSPSLRPTTHGEIARVAGEAPTTAAPQPGAPANVVPASVRQDFPEFPSVEAEVGFLQTRLPGAKLEHENWTRSLALMTSALEQAVSSSERAELERRRALLEAKLSRHDALVEQMEGRIAELERSGGIQTGAR
jgi:hypothetical protein